MGLCLADMRTSQEASVAGAEHCWGSCRPWGGESSECGILWAKARTSFQLLQEASEEFKFRRRDL